MPEQLILTKFLPYLLNRAGVQTEQMFSLALKGFGLTLPEWRILIVLWQGEDRRLRDLAETTIVDESTLSRQIAALEQADLVVRRRSKTDGRALCIALTPKGKKLTARIIPIAQAHAAAAKKA
jgi:DNA-binding MarR family transcriptional regulator